MEDVIMALSQNETMSQGFSGAGVPPPIGPAGGRRYQKATATLVLGMILPGLLCCSALACGRAWPD
jgi:hypothetical protein